MANTASSTAGDHRVAPPKPQRPAPPTTEQLLTTQRAVGRKIGEPAIERDEAPGYGWTLFVGAIIGLAFVKETLGRIGENPVTVQARSVSRADTAFSTALLLRMLAGIGSRVLGIRATGS